MTVHEFEAVAAKLRELEDDFELSTVSLSANVVVMAEGGLFRL